MSTHTALMPIDLPFTLTGQPLLGTPESTVLSIESANRYSPCLSIIYDSSRALKWKLAESPAQ